MGFKSLPAILLGCCLLATFVTSLVLVREKGMYVSPDETANAVFATLYADEGKLALREPLNTPLADALHPRSVLARDGLLVPSGFLGIPLLFGFAGKVFGTWMIPLLTSLLALLGACAWWGIVRRLYDRETAFLATFFLAVHPAWWYYSARALMPNVPFIACLLLAIWWGMRTPVATNIPKRSERWKHLDAFFCGLLFGAALLIRPAELPWIALGALVFYAIVRPRIHRASLAWFFGAVALCLLPLLPLNASLYGSPFVTGYTATSSSEASAEDVALVPLPAPAPGSEAPGWWLSAQRLVSPVFPFGLHPRNALRATWSYGFGLFWWMTLLALLGLFFAVPNRSLAREVRGERRAFLAVFGVVSVWLFILYGSWAIHDNPDPAAVSIANSYVRYWLPFFVLTTVPAALSVRALARRFPRGASFFLVPVLLLVCAALSVRATFFAPHDGLVSVARTLAVSREIKTRLLELTEPNAVIVVDRGDKLFFPERNVLYPLRDERTYALLPRIVLLAPLYYYGITFPETDLTYLNEEKLRGLGLAIEHVETYNEESLYRLIPAPSKPPAL